MTENQAIVLLLSIELLIPHAQSLKQKRSAVKGLKDRIRARFNASVAEVGHLESWQRATLAACLVGNSRRNLESDAARLVQLCEEARDLQPAQILQEWL